MGIIVSNLGWLSWIIFGALAGWSQVSLPEIIPVWAVSVILLWVSSEHLLEDGSTR